MADFNLVSYVEGRIYEQFVIRNSDNPNLPIEIVDKKVAGWGNVQRFVLFEHLLRVVQIPLSEVLVLLQQVFLYQPLIFFL